MKKTDAGKAMKAKYGGPGNEDVYIRFTKQDLGKGQGGKAFWRASQYFENGSYFWEEPRFKRRNPVQRKNEWDAEFQGVKINNEDAISHFILIPMQLPLT